MKEKLRERQTEGEAVKGGREGDPEGSLNKSGRKIQLDKARSKLTVFSYTSVVFNTLTR